VAEVTRYEFMLESLYPEIVVKGAFGQII
jgi:hypothetical protein